MCYGSIYIISMTRYVASCALATGSRIFMFIQFAILTKFVKFNSWCTSIFQDKILEKDDRCLAETHYQLGVAHSFSDDFDMAVESFKVAVKVIELRICNLTKKKKERESWTEEQKAEDGKKKIMVLQ